MFFIYIIFIILLIPFIGLGVILYLGVLLNQNKKLLKRFRHQADNLYHQGKITYEEYIQFGGNEIPSQMTKLKTIQNTKKYGNLKKEMKSENNNVTLANKQEPISLQIKNNISHKFQQRTTALIIGVLFIIISGFIFATTTWHVLLSGAKAILILVMTVIFFIASLLAEKKLHIDKTANAFYILGSIFLFVTTIAFGYFRLLGPTLTPLGTDNAMLFLLGTALTETAFIIRLKKWDELIYRYICLYGLSLMTILLIAALHLTKIAFSCGLTLFAGVIVLSEPVLKRAKEERLKKLLQVYCNYKIVNLWIVSVFILGFSTFNVLSGLTILLLSGIHFWISYKEEKGSAGAYGFTFFLLFGIVRLVSPTNEFEWLYPFAITTLFLALLDLCNIFTEKLHKQFRGLSQALGIFAFVMTIVSSGNIGHITLPAIICNGLILLDITLLSWKKNNKVLYGIHSIILAVFVNMIFFYFNIPFAYKLLGVMITLGICYFAGYYFKFQWRTIISDCVFAANIFIYVLILDIQILGKYIVHHHFDMVHLCVSLMGAVILGIGSYLWEKKYDKIHVFPLFAGLLPIPIWGIARLIVLITLKLNYFVFVYFILLCAWDLYKKKKYYSVIVPIGVVLPIMFYFLNATVFPYSFCLVGYIIFKIKNHSDKKYQYQSLCFAGFNFFFGIYLMMDGYINLFIDKMFILTGILVVGYYMISAKKEKTKQILQFLNVTGTVLYILTMIEFYGNGFLEIEYLIPCGAVFLWMYYRVYKEGKCWLSLIITLFFLGIPFVSVTRYGIDENTFYCVVMAISFVSTIIVRHFIPVIVQKGEKQYDIDWYHILQVVVILPMLYYANKEWRFYYVLLLIVYTMQYRSIENWRKYALTGSGILACIAFWVQPWFIIPQVIFLEIQLIPMVIVTIFLPYLWEKTIKLSVLQNILYALYLGLLLLDALRTGLLVDVLILQGICLSIFILAFLKKCQLWAKGSGALMIGIVLYMTRSFWFSISWWVYLLAVGIGLIGFAAVNEFKKR